VGRVAQLFLEKKSIDKEFFKILYQDRVQQNVGVDITVLAVATEVHDGGGVGEVRHRMLGVKIEGQVREPRLVVCRQFCELFPPDVLALLGALAA